MFPLRLLLPVIALISFSGCTINREHGADYLGCYFDTGSESASLAIWAPNAERVELVLNEQPDFELPIARIPLQRAASGVWRTEIVADRLGVSSLAGLFYQFIIDGRKVLDPYARSMAANHAGTGIAAIVDLDRYDVSGFANVQGYEIPEDAVIYEIHVRDFTVDPDIESLLSGQRFGTYLAFMEKLDYLKHMGVTHIQLLPVMAYYYGDEHLAHLREWDWISGESNYNWGYDPHSYFAPEGMYASDPGNPQARVDELKQLIEAIHQQGMAVILDVVYNHHPVSSILDPIEPGYYYRGTNDSFAGVDIASENHMVRKLIVDSLVYWTREYKVDGFRFDLMGLIDRETMRAAYAEVSKLNPKTLFIGEGWRMYQGQTPAMADQDWILEQDFAAVFSDEIRDLIKSGYNDEGTPRFVSGGKEDITHLFENLVARPSVNLVADDPGDLVQYAAAHDNLTLHDVIALATGLDPDIPGQEREILKRQRLANLLILTSQGIAFLHGGQEYGRSKRWKGDQIPQDSHTSATGDIFIHNSYDSPDIVNFFDWSRVLEPGFAKETMEFTRGLIELRRSSDAFRLGTAEKIAASTAIIDSPDIEPRDNVIAYSVRSSDGQSFHLFVNADTVVRELRIDADLTTADIIVDGRSAGSQPIRQPAGVSVSNTSVTLQPLTAAVFRR